MSSQQEIEILTEEVMEAGCGEIWKLIMEYKQIAEERDIRRIVDKFKTIPQRAMGIGIGSEGDQYQYCLANKIPVSYNGARGGCGDNDDIMPVRIVFHHFNRKLPNASKLPENYKKCGMLWNMVRDCWDEEDKNLYLIAKAFCCFQDYDGLEMTPERMMKKWAQKGIEYTGMPQFIQMGIDQCDEYYRPLQYPRAHR